MIKFQDLKAGDYVLATQDGTVWPGEVTNFNRDEKEICVDNGVQGFWFKADQLSMLPLNEAELLKLNFEREELEDGSVKYKKGAFRILIPIKDDFSKFDIWYREEKRHIMQPISVHQLQNHHLEMTKIHLTRETFN